MRFSRLFYALRVGTALLPAITACSGSNDDELSAGNMDAGGSLDGGSADSSTPGADDGGGGDPDGGPGPDGSTPRGPMTFTLHYNRRPVPNAVVVLHDADGAATGSLNTDALGQVHPPVAPHMLTVLPPLDFLRLMEGGPISYLGVETGDNLFIDLDQIGIDPPSEGSYAVTLPSLVPGANFYAVSAGSDDCASSAGSDGQLDDAIALATKCIRSQSIDVFAAAQQAGTGPLKYAYAKDQPVPASGSVHDLQLTEWVDPDQVTVSIVNTDALEIPLADVYGEVGSYRNGGWYWTGSSPGTPSATNTWQDHTALGFFDSLSFNARFSRYPVGESLYSALEQRTLPQTAFELDATLALPPVRVQGIDMSNFMRPVVSLTPEASNTADATVLQVSFEANGTDGPFWHAFWTFVVPPDATQLSLPDPSVYAAHLGVALEDATSVGVVLFDSYAYDLDTTPDYDAFRQLPIDFTSYIEGQSFDVQRPTPSLLRTTNWRREDD